MELVKRFTDCGLTKSVVSDEPLCSHYWLVTHDGAAILYVGTKDSFNSWAWNIFHIEFPEHPFGSVDDITKVSHPFATPPPCSGCGRNEQMVNDIGHHPECRIFGATKVSHPLRPN